MIVFPLTETEAEELTGQWYAPGVCFNPVFINDTWMISLEEISQCVNPEFEWVKQIEPVEMEI